MSPPQLATPAPWFQAPTHATPQFAFGNAAGRWVLLGFLPDDAAAREAVLEQVRAHAGLFGDATVAVFLVVRDPAVFAAQGEGPGLRWFLDADGSISRLYGVAEEGAGESPAWFLLDPSLRVFRTAVAARTAELMSGLRSLPAVNSHAGVEIHAPVLIVPRILEAGLCRRLIEHYEAHGGEPSGVMQQHGDRTVGVLSDMKRRKDALIADPELRDALRARIAKRLVPEIKKAFQFEVTRIERYIVACYDANDGGYFRTHRDNTTAGTAHRRFACSINLNAEEFEGGDLRFPEFGSRTYRPPTGGAVVFSCSLLHEATPVTRGTRYATLPFLHDEAAQKVRQANLHALATDPDENSAAA